MSADLNLAAAYGRLLAQWEKTYLRAYRVKELPEQVKAAIWLGPTLGLGAMRAFSTKPTLKAVLAGWGHGASSGTMWGKEEARAAAKAYEVAMTPDLGRPEVGPLIGARMKPELVERIDEQARAAGVSRAAWIRKALTKAVNNSSHESGGDSYS